MFLLHLYKLVRRQPEDMRKIVTMRRTFAVRERTQNHLILSDFESRTIQDNSVAERLLLREQFCLSEPTIWQGWCGWFGGLNEHTLSKWVYKTVYGKELVHDAGGCKTILTWLETLVTCMTRLVHDLYTTPAIVAFIFSLGLLRQGRQAKELADHVADQVSSAMLAKTEEKNLFEGLLNLSLNVRP